MTAPKKKPKRKYKTLTDEEILDLLRDGVIWVVGTQVFSRGRQKVEDIFHRGYRHVRIYHDNKRKSIAKHRLIWMAANGQVIPPGCEIHHSKGKSNEFPQHLELLTTGQHHALHDGGDYPADWDDDF